jgi:hypothetical protein
VSIVALDREDAAILTTLNVRRVAPAVTVVASERDVLSFGEGLDLLARGVVDKEVGRSPGDLGVPVLLNLLDLLDLLDLRGIPARCQPWSR